jgi:hypothetical protein
MRLMRVLRFDYPIEVLGPLPRAKKWSWRRLTALTANQNRGPLLIKTVLSRHSLLAPLPPPVTREFWDYQHYHGYAVVKTTKLSPE